MQLTVRMPDQYTEKLHKLSRKMGLKRSDIVRLALKQFLEANHGGEEKLPFEKVKHLLGIAGSGIKDLGKNHRRHLIEKLKRNV